MGSPKSRIAIPPLRRTAVWDPDLHAWLVDASAIKKNQGDPRHVDLQELLGRWESLADVGQAKKQVSRFYLDWTSQLRRTPETGRALALYQDLSAAYVFASGLPDLPHLHQPGLSRKPGSVVEQLMLVTL